MCTALFCAQGVDWTSNRYSFATQSHGWATAALQGADWPICTKTGHRWTSSDIYTRQCVPKDARADSDGAGFELPTLWLVDHRSPHTQGRRSQRRCSQTAVTLCWNFSVDQEPKFCTLKVRLGSRLCLYHKFELQKNKTSGGKSMSGSRWGLRSPHFRETPTWRGRMNKNLPEGPKCRGFSSAGRK